MVTILSLSAQVMLAMSLTQGSGARTGECVAATTMVPSLGNTDLLVRFFQQPSMRNTKLLPPSLSQQVWREDFGFGASAGAVAVQAPLEPVPSLPTLQEGMRQARLAPLVQLSPAAAMTQGRQCALAHRRRHHRCWHHGASDGSAGSAT